MAGRRVRERVTPGAGRMPIFVRRVIASDLPALVSLCRAHPRYEPSRTLDPDLEALLKRALFNGAADFRLRIGLEDPQDLCRDLDRVLCTAFGN